MTNEEKKCLGGHCKCMEKDCPNIHYAQCPIHNGTAFPPQEEAKPKEESWPMCGDITEHEIVWAGDGYFCSKCRRRFVSEKTLSSEKQKSYKEGYDRHRQEIVIIMDAAEKRGMSFKAFIEAYCVLLQANKENI